MSYERKINYYETDKMGIVHHSNYIRFLEEARGDLLEKIGLPYDEVEKKGLMIPVLGVKCNYKFHSTYADTLSIKLKIKEFKGVKMIVEYVITNKETEQLLVTAETSHCFTDKNLKPLNMKKAYPEIYERIINS